MRNKDRCLLEMDVIKAIDKHTREDGTLDDDISCILEEVESVDAKYTNVTSKWIPCSERLPKDRQIVVADLECSIEGRMCIFAYLKIVDYMGRWINANTGFPVLANVVKWTPLPEPYREVTDEEEAGKALKCKW